MVMELVAAENRIAIKTRVDDAINHMETGDTKTAAAILVETHREVNTYITQVEHQQNNVLQLISNKDGLLIEQQREEGNNLSYYYCWLIIRYAVRSIKSEIHHSILD